MKTQYSARRVLIVDDYPDAAEVVAQLLTLRGHRVAVAHSGAEAIAVAEKLAPEVVFLDIGMPDMDGYEVAARMRGAARFSSTRIVALTAWDSGSVREKAAVSGIDAHLLKPACLESLLIEADQPRLPR
jgi:CheY-like chemotaxis protein